MRSAARAPSQTPAIELGDFRLVVHRRQFPDAQDRWDGNWLDVTAQCAQAGAIVAAAGPLLETGDLARFRRELAALTATGDGEAVLRGEEPNVVVRVTAPRGLGELHVRVEVTPQPQAQGHWFACVVDPSYAFETIRQLDAVLALFPLRGQRTTPLPDVEDAAAPR
jgi:hypothetical protein